MIDHNRIAEAFNTRYPKEGVTVRKAVGLILELTTGEFNALDIATILKLSPVVPRLYWRDQARVDRTLANLFKGGELERSSAGRGRSSRNTYFQKEKGEFRLKINNTMGQAQ